MCHFPPATCRILHIVTCIWKCYVGRFMNETFTIAQHRLSAAGHLDYYWATTIPTRHTRTTQPPPTTFARPQDTCATPVPHLNFEYEFWHLIISSWPVVRVCGRLATAIGGKNFIRRSGKNTFALLRNLKLSAVF